ncbi:MAG: ThuA domain-containing protein [Bacteroidia bacterium]|nr:ThuA domain-containing protein [Bacteroidia bacterium]
MIDSHFRLRVLFLVTLGGLAFTGIRAQPISLAQFVVYAGNHDRFNTPVKAALNGIPIPSEENHTLLYEVSGNARTPVVFQVENGPNPLLWWVVSGKMPAGSHRVFEWVSHQDSLPSAPGITVKNNSGFTLFETNGKKILQYQYEEVAEPEGKNPLYRRGGFIHPLWTPAGEVLTRIQPSDHYHHYGIWNPWTRTTFQGRSIDFWNLYEGQGTVRPQSRPTVQSGPVYGQVSAVHEHIDLMAPHPSGALTALSENWDIRVWNTDPGNKIWLVDFVSKLHCATDSPLKIDAYRYQGFGFRGTAKWDDQTATLLTSEGKNKTDGNATRARWCDVNGVSVAGTSGILFMTHPTNYNFPEQLRIWPTGTNNGKENVFFNFNPAQEQDWIIKPGKEYVLNYRMMIYDGKITPETAEQYWNDFAHPPKVEVVLKRPAHKPRVLVYTKNGKGYVHDNLEAATAAIKKLGIEHGFDVDASADPAVMTGENLQKYDALIFASTNNETFDTDAQKQAFQRYIESGGGFVGIHSASGSERQWPWFQQMLGGKFRRHPPLQTFSIEVKDRFHPSTLALGSRWEWEDECYYLDHLNPGIHVLLAADLTTIEDEKKDEYPGKNFGDLFPISWYQEQYGGRQWYTALGHKIEYYSNPVFLQHILGGILWATDKDE